MSTRLYMLGLAALVACTSPLPAAGPDATPDPTAPTPSYDDDTDTRDSSDRTLRFYYGPMKIMNGENALFSIGVFTGHDFGGWDYTTPEPTSEAFFDSGNAEGRYYRHCRQLGGCMEHRIPLGRTGFVNTGFVLQLERAVIEACNDTEAFGMFPGNEAPETTAAIDVLRHQYRAAFGALPTDEELELSSVYFEGHIEDPERSDMSALESAGRGHCRALLATNRFLFY